MNYSKKSLQYLARHANQKADGNWYCKQTGTQVEFRGVEQLVESDLPRKTKSKQVFHAFCPACTIQPDVPQPGTRISASDLASLGLVPQAS